jgi:ribonuclease HII
VSIDETNREDGRSQAFGQMTVTELRTLIETWDEEAVEWAQLERDHRVGVRRLVVQARKRWAQQRVECARRAELLQFEQRLWGREVFRVAGVDEVGRGCLAGPVVAAAVILPPDFVLPGLDDSKKISRKKREVLYDAIQTQAVAIGIGQIEAGEIDRLNILQASLKAMREALIALDPVPQHVLVDGHIRPGSPFEETAIVDGDARSQSIAAASVIAKVHRDRLMVDYDETYPEYGFASHKGYGSPEHLSGLRSRGPCPLHRRSFGPVAALVRKPRSALFTSFAEGFVACTTLGELERMAHFVKEGSSELAAEELRDLRQMYREKRTTIEDIGRRGEERAGAYLVAAGYEVLETRYRGAGGEIDLVVQREGEYAFVEVKTRKDAIGYAPEERVDAQKRQRLVRAARHYLHYHNIAADCRFDVIAVVLEPGEGVVEHWADAFRP